VSETISEEERIALLALGFVPGIGNYIIRQLISYCGSASRVFDTPKGKLQKIPGIGPKTAEAIHHHRTMDRAEKEWIKAKKEQVNLLFYLDKHYPSRLKEINDAPFVLYARGNMDFENSRVVGIVGTRKASSYGKACVEELVEGLAPHGVLIVSGLAYGIDIAAHKAAMRHGLPTVAVMGSGIDVIYPSSHRDAARKMEMNGGLVTEKPFGTPPDAHHFPERNRIIAGLCDAIVVAEATRQGGALITAELANDYNREVFAFPGSINHTTSAGCNYLIKTQRAQLITSASDLLEYMNWNTPQSPSADRVAMRSMDVLNETEREIVIALRQKSPMILDEISWRTGLPVSQLAGILLTLEFKGWVKSLPGKQYALAC
jgi:DNA processing protein